MYLYGRVLSLVTVSHQETSPRDKITLAPPDRKSTHTLSSTVRKDENRVLSRNTQYRHQTCGTLDTYIDIKLYVGYVGRHTH